MSTSASPRRRSGAQFVYEELLAQIQDMRLEPGRRLNEAELASALGVSRTPLREALRLLLAEDLLEQLPTGGMVVRRLSTRDAAELYAVRARLEALVAAAAAERAGPADVDRLTALLDRNEALAGLPEGAMESGHALHLEIERIADHAWASRVLGADRGPARALPPLQQRLPRASLRRARRAPRHRRRRSPRPTPPRPAHGPRSTCSRRARRRWPSSRSASIRPPAQDHRDHASRPEQLHLDGGLDARPRA